MSERPKLLFATGGTGGHIYPAIAIAKAAERRGYASLFLGQQGGMEARIVPREGLEFQGVAAGKWDRERPNPYQGVKALQGLIQALTVLKRYAPDLVIGFGGFASFPGLAAARLLGRPYLLHEGNAFPGRVTRWFAPGAQQVAISHDAIRTHLASAKLIFTGFPVREARLDKAEARARLGLPAGGLLTLVMGGSQGSTFLNEAVPEAYRALRERDAVAEDHSVLHSTGPRWIADVESRCAAFSQYVPRDYVDATLAWSAADLAITRAGISTLSEAAFHGVPLVMVPLPSSAENHQLHNAQAFADEGAGWLVEEKDRSKLTELWGRALGERTRNLAARAALQLSPEGAADAFVDLIDQVLPAPRGRGTLQEFT